MAHNTGKIEKKLEELYRQWEWECSDLFGTGPSKKTENKIRKLQSKLGMKPMPKIDYENISLFGDLRPWTLAKKLRAIES